MKQLRLSLLAMLVGLVALLMVVVGAGGANPTAAVGGGGRLDSATRLVRAQDRYVGGVPGQNSHEIGFFYTTTLASFLTATNGSADNIGTGTDAVTTYAPTAVDMENWLDTLQAAGGTYGILVTKHHSGFKLWNSATDDYGVNNAALSGAASLDVVKLFTDGCRKRGIRPVLYFSMWDLHQESILGVPAIGNAAAWATLIKAQLTELLTNYGPIDAVWIDGWGWHFNYDYTYLPYATFHDHVKTKQPNCLFINSDHYHPSGYTNGDGHVIPAWSTSVSDLMTLELYIDNAPNLLSADQTTYRVEQGFPTLVSGEAVRWFDAPTNVTPLHANFLAARQWLNDLQSINANAIINMPPNRSGVMRPDLVTLYMEAQNLLRVPPVTLGATPTASTSFGGTTLPAQAIKWEPWDHRTQTQDGSDKTFSGTPSFWSSAAGDNNPYIEVPFAAGALTFNSGDVLIWNRQDDAGPTLRARMQNVTMELRSGATVVATSGTLNINNAMVDPIYLRWTGVTGTGDRIRIRKTYNGTDTGGVETLAVAQLYACTEALGTPHIRELDSFAVSRQGTNAAMTFTFAGANSFEYFDGQYWTTVTSPFTGSGEGLKASFSVRALDSKRNVLATSTKSFATTGPAVHGFSGW